MLPASQVPPLKLLLAAIRTVARSWPTQSFHGHNGRNPWPSSHLHAAWLITMLTFPCVKVTTACNFRKGGFELLETSNISVVRGHL
mmetsp:Transcript_40472/g.81122  ORF Transcript_40472/g.81122 Transcript_40472/m.81122 type:complete len:86 (+) Transcript_40472:176-433(+)